LIFCTELWCHSGCANEQYIYSPFSVVSRHPRVPRQVKYLFHSRKAWLFHLFEMQEAVWRQGGTHSAQESGSWSLQGLFSLKLWPVPGKSYWRGRLSTVDLLIKVACFVKKANNIFSIKISCSKLVRTRKSTVLSLLLLPVL